MPRPETGPMQFPGDWTGIFIRGDNALALAGALEEMLRHYLYTPRGMPVRYRNHLSSLINTLRSCDEAASKDGQMPTQKAEDFIIVPDLRLEDEENDQGG